MESVKQQHDNFAEFKSRLFTHHRAQLDLCRRLESVADDLPNNFNPQECLSISWQLFSTVKAAHKFEEEELFPMLDTVTGFPLEMKKTVERLRYEHWEDEMSAEDISFYLKQLVRKPEDVNIGKTSYMLRGFFDGMRRHTAFEAEYLLPYLEFGLR